VVAGPKLADRRERGLFRRVGFQVEAVRRQPEAELDITHALPLRAFVSQSVPRALPDGFALPLAHRTHDRDHQASCGRAGVEGFRHGDPRDLALLEQFQQPA